MRTLRYKKVGSGGGCRSFFVVEARKQFVTPCYETWGVTGVRARKINGFQVFGEGVQTGPPNRENAPIAASSKLIAATHKS